eukprot:5653976-Pleurochrysis_carterae.AAC.1
MRAWNARPCCPDSRTATSSRTSFSERPSHTATQSKTRLGGCRFKLMKANLLWCPRGGWRIPEHENVGGPDSQAIRAINARNR